MKKLILINCYFGKLPEYVDFYLKSAGANPTVDFLLVTDDKTQRDYPQNVIVKYMSFADLKEEVQKQFDFEISLSAPYKLCDYKPTYGKVFYQTVKSYDFWGYADIDLIFGDIRSFITDEVLFSHDKIQSAGHFTLLPTTDEGINFFTYEIEGISYKKAFTTDQNLAFDEWAGVSTVYKILGKKVYNEVNDFADLSYKHWYFLPSEEVYRRA